MLTIILGGIIGYVIGSIPPGYIYLRVFKGVDIRTVASGRTGATNAGRAGGTAMGVVTALSDILKGACAVWAARALLGGMVDETTLSWAVALAGIGAVAGHNWSLFLNFKGGAGTTPNIGWAAAVWWPIFPIGFTLGALVLRYVGMASVASMFVGVLIPVILGIRYAIGADPSPAYLVAALITGGSVFWALRPNIQRLLNGTERIIGPRARAAAKQKASQQSR
jgi:glycerol-3-phosphate acyltransferase PlsY